MAKKIKKKKTSIWVIVSIILLGIIISVSLTKNQNFKNFFESTLLTTSEINRAVILTGGLLITPPDGWIVEKDFLPYKVTFLPNPKNLSQLEREYGKYHSNIQIMRLNIEPKSQRDIENEYYPDLKSRKTFEVAGASGVYISSNPGDRPGTEEVFDSVIFNRGNNYYQAMVSYVGVENPEKLKEEFIKVLSSMHFENQ